MPQPRQETLPGTPGPSVEAMKRQEILTTLFHAIRETLSPCTFGLPANGETKITITKIVEGDTIQINYKPGEL